MKFLNLTPHDLCIVNGGRSVHLSVDGPAPRLEVLRESLGILQMENTEVGIVRSTMGKPLGLPDPQQGIILIVSALVAEHPVVAHRIDLAYPGEAIRENGKIVGAHGLCAGPGLASALRGEEIHGG